MNINCKVRKATMTDKSFPEEFLCKILAVGVPEANY